MYQVWYFLLIWNTVSLYYWFITLNLWHFIGRNLKTLNKCVKIFYCSYIQTRMMCKRMNYMTCMPFWLIFKYDLHVCMAHVCHHDLHVTVTYMSLWPICLCDLYVIMSYISVWPICHYDLYVCVTYMSLWPTYRCDLYVIMTYMSLWATFLCDLYVFMTYMSLWPTCLSMLGLYVGCDHSSSLCCSSILQIPGESTLKRNFQLIQQREGHPQNSRPVPVQQQGRQGQRSAGSKQGWPGPYQPPHPGPSRQQISRPPQPIIGQ